MQNHYNLVYREEEREMIPQCIDQGVGVIPWSPLARGLLAGNRTASGERLTARSNNDTFADSLYSPDLDQPVIDRAAELAAARGVSSAQMALAWLFTSPASPRRSSARPNSSISNRPSPHPSSTSTTPSSPSSKLRTSRTRSPDTSSGQHGAGYCRALETARTPYGLRTTSRAVPRPGAEVSENSPPIAIARCSMFFSP